MWHFPIENMVISQCFLWRPGRSFPHGSWRLGGDPALGLGRLRRRGPGAAHQRRPTAGGQEVLGEGADGAAGTAGDADGGFWVGFFGVNA